MHMFQIKHFKQLLSNLPFKLAPKAQMACHLSWKGGRKIVYSKALSCQSNKTMKGPVPCFKRNNMLLQKNGMW